MILRRDPLVNPAALISRVYAYVSYRVGPGADAEDITSDVFERAVRYRSRFDEERGEPIAWLIGIASRCIVDASRSRELPVADMPDVISAGHEEGSLLRLEILGVIDRLGERERELIALRYGADLSARQIGALLGMKTNAVEVSIHRTLKRLRLLLEGGDVRIGSPRPAPVGSRAM